MSADATHLISTAVVRSLAQLIDKYECFVFDGCGTLYSDGATNSAAVSFLHILERVGKQVVVLVNSSLTHDELREWLNQSGIRTSPKTLVMSSTGYACQLLSACPEAIGRKTDETCLLMDSNINGSFLADLPYQLVDDPLKADFVMLRGRSLEPRIRQSGRQTLTIARLRNLTLICTNPEPSREFDDIKNGVIVLAEEYERSGGNVQWIGKPHRGIYDSVLSKLDVPIEKVIAIGDDINIDIRGAAGLGIDTMLFCGGIHRDVFSDATDDTEMLLRLDVLLKENDMPVRPRWLAMEFPK